MYRPPYSQNEDPALALELIREYPLGLLVCVKDQKIDSNFLPFLVEKEGDQVTLLTHFAKANPQWKNLQGEVLVSFQGPQRYISPAMYVSPSQVPTWSYGAVQAFGRTEIIADGNELRELLHQATQVFEEQNGTNWTYDVPLPALEAAIVGVKIKVDRLEAKFKFSQNRKPEDYQAVLESMKNSAKPKDQEIYAWMLKTRTASFQRGSS